MAKLGRPLKFESPEILQSMIDEYFKDCEERKEPPFISELAVWLDTSRETLANYEERDEFFDTIKRAKQKCEAAVEKGMMVGKLNATASIFNLKNNYGWRDKYESDLTTGGDKIIFIPNEVANKLKQDGTTQ